MFLIYLDESGKPARSDQSENYVIAGIIANEENWNEIDEKVTNLKKHYLVKTGKFMNFM